MARAMKDSGIAWIGEIPEGWTKSRIKNAATFEPACDITNLRNDSVVTYTPMEYIKNGYFIQNDATWSTLSTSLTPYQEGDIVMAKVTPCFENGNIAIMTGLSSGIGFGSSELFVFRPKHIDRQFLFFWLQNEGFKQQAISTMTGTGGLKRVSPAFVRNCILFLPPLPEQSRIAAFLDRRCAEIDRVMEQTRETIEEYKRLKQSIITEAVTHGIRPGRKMKNSGVEWIGEIPEEWRVSNLGSVTLSMRNGYVGPTKDLFVDDGVPYIQSLHIKDGSIDFERHEYYVSNEWAISHPKIKTDDVLIVQTGDIGSVAIVPAKYNDCNCHALIIATPNQELVLSRYLTYYLRSKVGRELLLFYKTGALLPHLNSGKIKFASICVPQNIVEQRRIVDYLDSKCAEIDRVIDAKQQLLSQLEAYKKSVIYEYVTGKREVPDTQDQI